MSSTHYLPRWTKRFVIEGGGRDPLGLSRVAFTLTDYLLTGIITTTDRARYYSFYSWALWHIAQEENSDKYDDFVSALRRREAAMAMATLAAEPLSSPVGVRVVNKQLARGKQTGEYDCDFKVLPSNPLGGYGQYYGSSIYHLKLSRHDDNFIPNAANDGEELAQAFHETIRNTKYIKNRKYLDPVISESDLDELQTRFTLDALGENFARKEREKLIEILFSLNENLTDEKSVFRRQTLTVLLHLINQYEKNGSCAETQTGRALDEYLLFAIYYEVLWIYSDDGSEAVADYDKLKNHEHCYELWQQFCLHQFIGQALEYFLYAVLEAIGAEVTGKSLAETIAIITQPDFFTILKETVGSNCDTPQKLLFGLDIKTVPDESFCKNRQKIISPIHIQSEAQILSLEEKTAEEAAAKATLLLATLYGKWRGLYQSNVMRLVAHHAGPEVWAKSVLSTLDEWLKPDTTWEDALTGLIEEFILNQHDRIMYEKRRLDSSWLHRTAGKIVKDQDYRPNWRASRFFNAARIMADLRLVEIDDEKKIAVTPEGEKLLKCLVN